MTEKGSVHVPGGAGGQMPRAQLVTRYPNSRRPLPENANRVSGGRPSFCRPSLLPGHGCRDNRAPQEGAVAVTPGV